MLKRSFSPLNFETLLISNRSIVPEIIFDGISWHVDEEVYSNKQMNSTGGAATGACSFLDFGKVHRKRMLLLMQNYDFLI